MKVFNGKQAAEDYMSTHTLVFSTPELTLMRYSFCLGEIVPDPEDRKKTVLRYYTFVEEKDFQPVQIIDDDKYVPTGAVRVSGIYGNQETETNSDVKFWSECGTKISPNARFCTDCGATQD